MHIDISGAVIVNEQGNFLLVQEKKPKVFGLWNLPAGWRNSDETAPEAAIRETREEVGLDIKLLSSEPLYEEEDKAKDRTYRAFKAKVIGGAIQIQEEEILDAHWFNIEAIKRLQEQGKIRASWIVKSVEIVAGQSK